MTSTSSALATRCLFGCLSGCLSISLTLGSTVALAAPAGDPPPTDPAHVEGGDAGGGEVETGATDQQKDEAQSLSDKAIAEFTAKNFAGAVELFEQAYELDPQPNYLFNIGRVYEEAGDLEKAVEYYAKFVKQPGVDLDSRETALERLRVLRAIVEETSEPKDEPEAEPEEEPKEVAPVTTPPQPVDQKAERKRKIMRGTGFGLVGAGAGALIGAAVVGSLAQGDRDKAFDRDEADNLAARQYYLEKAQTKALTADILYGVGGALLLTGVVLVAVGYSKPKSSRVALTPSFGPNGTSVDLRLRF